MSSESDLQSGELGTFRDSVTAAIAADFACMLTLRYTWVVLTLACPRKSESSDFLGYTPITKAQANRFFSFVSDAYERSSLVFTTNKEIPDWAEMVQDPVLSTALMDRILHHARCFSLRGESYRLKHPELYAHRD